LEDKFIKEEKVVINNIMTIKQLIENIKNNQNIGESEETIPDEEDGINFVEVNGDHHHHQKQYERKKN